MDLKQIEALLIRYYNGDTTLEEERKLKEFFNGENVPDHLKSEQLQFCFFMDSAEENTGLDIEKKLGKEITPKSKTVPLFNFKNSFRLIGAIAASISLLLGMYL